MLTVKVKLGTNGGSFFDGNNTVLPNQIKEIPETPFVLAAIGNGALVRVTDEEAKKVK